MSDPSLTRVANSAFPVAGATIGGLAARLARRDQPGWVWRNHNLPDRRRVSVELTPAGDAILKATWARGTASYEHVRGVVALDELPIVTDVPRRVRDGMLDQLGHRRTHILAVGAEVLDE